MASIHEKKKSFKCEICDYSCSPKGHMKEHVAAIHERKKQFKCDTCDYSFYYKGQMSAQVHEQKRPSNVTFVITGVLLKAY